MGRLRPAPAQFAVEGVAEHDAVAEHDEAGARGAHDEQAIDALEGEADTAVRVVAHPGVRTCPRPPVWESQSGRGLSQLSGDRHPDLELVGDRIAFTVSEDAQGGRDLNRDSDAGDFVLHVYDA